MIQPFESYIISVTLKHNHLRNRQYFAQSLKLCLGVRWLIGKLYGVSIILIAHLPTKMSFIQASLHLRSSLPHKITCHFCISPHLRKICKLCPVVVFFSNVVRRYQDKYYTHSTCTCSETCICSASCAVFI